METHAQVSKWLWEKEVMDRKHEKLKKRHGIKLYYFSYFLEEWIAGMLMVRSAAFREAKWEWIHMAAMITHSILNNYRDTGSMLSFPVNVINTVRASFTQWSTPKPEYGTRAPISARF